MFHLPFLAATVVVPLVGCDAETLEGAETVLKAVDLLAVVVGLTDVEVVG